ncbi:DUF1659 domain-containing protein [Tepidibacter mesophilus]|uniref:DUF1659 domain-containing protein n=1 Tax=Tepidibacter mesophilus TaxID=655607 RepID=UPI000C08C142|nr:DUF1659 domain-containing protein [Tepidibacter mesophilus]
MAVTAIPTASAIKVKYSLGLDEKGNEKFKRKSFGNVKTDAIDQDVFDVAKALNGLQTLSVASIDRENVTNLSE